LSQILACQIPILSQMLACQIPILSQILACQIPILSQTLACQIPILSQILACQIPILSQILACQIPILSQILACQISILSQILACQIPILSQISGAGPLFGSNECSTRCSLWPVRSYLEPHSRVTVGIGRSQETATRSYPEQYELAHNLVVPYHIIILASQRGLCFRTSYKTYAFLYQFLISSSSNVDQDIDFLVKDWPLLST